MLSWSDLAKVWCEVNHVPFGGYDEIPMEVFEKHMPIPDLGREMGEMFLYFEEFGYTGGEEGVVLAQDVSQMTKRALRMPLIMIVARCSMPHEHVGRVCEVGGSLG